MKELSLKIVIKSPTGLIPLQSMANATGKILAILRAIDRQLSGGNVTTGWAIKHIKMRSPAELEIVPYNFKENSNPGKIISQSITGINGLKKKAVKPKYFSDNALENTRAFANIIDHKNIEDISIINGSKTVELNHHIVANIDSIIHAVKETPYGAIEGRLDMINIHTGLQVGIYREIDDRQVKALFEDDGEIKKTVRDFLGERVYAFGEIKRNKEAQPTAIMVKKLEKMPDGEKLPSLLDIFGIDPDFTDGLSVDEFLRKQRNE